MNARLRAAAVKVFGLGAVRAAAFALAAARQRSLILVYHRVLPDADARNIGPDPIVPCVSASLLLEQLVALRRIGRIVPLEALLDKMDSRLSPSTAPRFVITFDDDEPSHLKYALPVLQSLDVPATIFLSGRALHGLEPPWWIVLQAEIERSGIERTSRTLCVSARTPGELATLVERNQLAELVLRSFDPASSGAQLQPDELSALAAARCVTVGFHTLSHPVLTELDDAAVARELQAGRAALQAIVPGQVRFLAYPHGKANNRVAELARRSGYAIACQSGHRPVSQSTDRMRISRWEPGALPADALLSHAALRFSLGE